MIECAPMIMGASSDERILLWPSTTIHGMRLPIVVFCITASPALAAAGQVEAAVRAGQVVPFYSQSFHFDPGPFLHSTFPGVVVEPVQDLRLEGRGGLALGG